DPPGPGVTTPHVARIDAAGPAVSRAVGVPHPLAFRHRVESRRGVRHFAEDPRARGLAVLHVRRAVGAAAEELNAVEPADDVRVEREEVLDVAAVARQIAQLLLVEATRDRLALERDVVLSLRRHHDDFVEASELELKVGARDGRGPEEKPGALDGLES